jgi:hypothetical protein
MPTRNVNLTDELDAVQRRDATSHGVTRGKQPRRLPGSIDDGNKSAHEEGVERESV